MIGGCLGSLIGDLLATRLERRRARRRQVRFVTGAGARMHCALRRPIRSASWSHGMLTISSTQAVWRARLKRGVPITLVPATTSFLAQYAATPDHGLYTTMPMSIVVLNDGGQRLELAVLDEDTSLLHNLFGPGRPTPAPGATAPRPLGRMQPPPTWVRVPLGQTKPPGAPTPSPTGPPPLPPPGPQPPGTPTPDAPTARPSGPPPEALGPSSAPDGPAQQAPS